MVTCDVDSDFERRRRIRLQQVRQQSKEIAANVRNRVRKEKEKQLSKVEKEGEEQLKRWKSRKLLALQQQYRDCMEEIGSAHTRAALQRDPHEILNELEEKNQKEAEARGKLASDKQKNEEIQQKLLLSEPLERRKGVRKMENARSVMVSKLGRVKTTPIKKKKRKKVATDVTISSNIINASDTSQNSISDIENISSNIEDARKQGNSLQKSVIVESDYDSQQEMTRRGKKISPKKQKKMTQKKLTSTDESVTPGDISHANYTDDEINTPPSFRSDEISVQVSPLKNSGSHKNTNVQLSPSKVKDIIEQHRPIQMYSTNTRISDRIRQRKLNEDKDAELRNNNINYISNNFQREPVVHSNVTGPNKFNIDSYKICDIENEHPKETNLPFVPPTSVINEDETEGQTSKVRYYDHFNRFGKEYNAQPIVQKISKERILVHSATEVDETKDYYETMQRRDREAQCRGTKAMEKNQIQKDYKQLMEELPVLQRQERLASMRTHNPAFHLSDDRHKEMERKRQNRIENLFEKYYHKCKNLETPLITLKPVQKTPPAEEMKLPFTALDMTESPVQLNVAEWHNRETTPSTEHNTRTIETDNTDSRTTELADLLQRVNRQRELLIREVSSLPPSSNLQEILQDEEILKIACPCPKNSAESKERTTAKSSAKGKVFVSTATSPLAVISPSEKIQESGAKIQNSSTSSKREIDSSNSSEISADITIKRHKKVKVKKPKFALKDEETQTSPAIGKKSLSPKESKQPSSLASSTNKSVGEESKKSKSTTVQHEEKLCQIIIKLAEESSVQISTSSAAKQISLKPKDTVTQQQPTDSKTRKEKPVAAKGKESDRKHRSPPVSHQRRISNDISTSTTYMSPPDIQAVAGPSKMDKQRTLYKDMLKNKPQQTNIDRPDSGGRRNKQVVSSNSSQIKDKNINPHLFKYIQKLLSMSRQSIDDLTVSSVSDVSIPGPNVTDSADNTSIMQLHNVMSHFNLSFSDIQRYLTPESSSSSINNIETNQPIVTEAIVHTTNQGTHEPMEINESNLLPYSSILSKFTELAQSSCDKISNLTSMIDKIRLEKERLLSPLSSDKNDNSYTSYLELPPKFTTDSAQTKASENKPKQVEENSSSSSNSIGQDAVDRYLLSVGESNGLTESNVEANDPLNSNTASNEFVPMLVGIPKYDEDDSVTLLNFVNPNMNNFVFNTTKPKPPPALLRNAAKYNLNIDMTPHELSTIVELDTVTSSRNVSEIVIQRPRTPDEHIPNKDIGDIVYISRSDESSTQSEFVTISPERYMSPRETGIKKTSNGNVERKEGEHLKKVSPKSALKKPGNKSPSRPKSEISGVQPLFSDKSSSSPEDREAILRNMGLGWAVSTLKKTQESLALSSSSDSSKRHDISEIAGATGSQSRDKSQQRTSTPVHYSKSTDSKNKSKEHLFTGDSDLSSVRLHSDENLFLMGRVYLQLADTDPKPGQATKSKKKKVSNKFIEGWIEFERKSIAKQVASTLNNTQLFGKVSSDPSNFLSNKV
ncbi:hypothetical protein CBL_06655 [Carabus blaptoides fortunei]